MAFILIVFQFSFNYVLLSVTLIMQKAKPILAKRIFWDVNFDAIDYDEKWKFVIERVFDRGDIDDIRQVRRYYGDEKVIEALTTAMYLFDETINFCSGIFEIPKEKFRCYTLKQLNPVQSGF
jgi:hypothetical protein